MEKIYLLLDVTFYFGALLLAMGAFPLIYEAVESMVSKITGSEEYHRKTIFKIADIFLYVVWY